MNRPPEIPAKTDSPRRPAAGFALIVSLVFLAFLVLASLTLTSVVQVGTRASQESGNRALARANALLGLQQSLGGLQRRAGPDQRATAAADILSGADAPAPSRALWTGVWRTDAATDGTVPFDDPEALREWSRNTEGPRWLVSSPGGTVPDPRSAPSSAAVTLFRYAEENYDLTDETSPRAREDRVVRVEPAPVGESGRNAYWVADESLKADLSPLLPAEILEADADAPGGRWRLLTAHEPDLRAAEGLEDLAVGDPDAPWRAVWPALTRPGDLPLAASALGFSLPAEFSGGGARRILSDDFTFRSHGLLTDSRRAGLRKDLGHYARTGSGPAASDPIIDRGEYPDLEDTDAGLPRYGLVRGWHQQGQSISGYNAGAVAPQAHGEDRSGVFPILMRAGIHWHGGFQGDRFLLAFYPVAALWNPYNVPIEAHDYRFEIPIPEQLGLTLYDTDDSGQGGSPLLRFEQAGAEVNPTCPVFDLAGYLEELYGEPKFVFALDSPRIEPGEILYFTAETDAFGGSPYPTDPENPGRMENHPENLTYFFIDTGLSFSEPLPGNGTETGKAVIVDTGNGEVYSPGRQNSLDFEARLKTDGDQLLQDIREETWWFGPGYPGDGVQTGWQYDASALIDFDRPRFDSARLLAAPMGMSIRRAYLGDLVGSGLGFLVRRPWASLNVLAETIDSPPLLEQEMDFSPGARAKASVNVLPGNQTWFNNNIDQSPYDADKTVWAGLYSENREALGFPSEFVYPFFDLPRADIGFQSLGQLQHVRFAQKAWQPVYAFGNAEADAQIAREDYAGPFTAYGGDIAVGANGFTDLSWLLNDSLWDSHFVSTIPATGPIGLDGGGIDGDTRLPNTRLRFHRNPDGSWPGASEARDYDEAAAHLHLDGAFNVNSTSVDAWRMVLRATRSLGVDTFRAGEQRDEERSPFPRSPYPYGEAAGDDPDEDNLEHPSNFRGFAALSDEEIEALARRVVEQVRERGPFLSLADFVNRRLLPADDPDAGQGLTGALQEAVNRSSREQGLVNDRFTNLPNHDETEGGRLFAEDLEDSGLLTEHLAGAREGSPGYHGAGLPGYLTQADLLTVLGPLLTARGDTFVIRSYGEISGPENDEPTGQAWCEAVVQRVVTPVAASADDPFEPTANSFGRRFEVVDFRWLAPAEI